MEQLLQRRSPLLPHLAKGLEDHVHAHLVPVLEEVCHRLGHGVHLDLLAFDPDAVRDRNDTERYRQYHRGHWHYVNHFWAQSPDGPLALPHLEETDENATERLGHFAKTVVDPSISVAERATQLAWIIHLVGDLHQPLHASSRVTRHQPEGDRGGGLFQLDASSPFGNLHVYWDGILDLSYPQGTGESDREYALRLAERIPNSTYLDSTVLGSGPLDFEVWTLESTEIAQLAVYLPVVERGESPPDIYRRHALRISELQLRCAGLRLAALLNHLFG